MTKNRAPTWLSGLLALVMLIQPLQSVNQASAAPKSATRHILNVAADAALSLQGNAPYTLTDSTIGPVGGESLGGAAPAYPGGIAASSQPAARLSRADYRNVYADAIAALNQVKTYRETKLQSIAEEKVTTIAQLEQNYMDFNNGEEFNRFCSDYYTIDAQGYCPASNASENLRNLLIRARNSFSMIAVSAPADMQLEAENARTVGQNNVLATMRELANIHVIFGNEFMIDALDTIKSGDASALGAENLVVEEAKQLDAAIHQFRLAVDALVYAITVDVGGLNLDQSRGVRLADYFSDKEVQLFTIASERQVEAMTELAYRYRLLGKGTTITYADGRQELIQGDESALSLYNEAFQTQYLMTQTLAQLAAARDVDFLNNGGWKALNNLRNIQQQADVLSSGFNPFGYQEAYVPREEFDTLLAKSRERWKDADDQEKLALAAKRQFDLDASEIGNAKLAIIESYRTALVELCGGSGSESQVTAFSPCTGGLMQQNYLDLIQADRRIILARLRAENIDKEIAAFQNATAQTVEITLSNGKALAVDELSKAKLRAHVTSLSTLDTKSKSNYWGGETEFGFYGKAWLGGQASVSIGIDTGVDLPIGGIEAGLEIAAQCTEGYQHENTHTTSREVTFLPNEEKMGEIESLAQLRQAENTAQITQIEGDVHIGNLLRQQTELLVEVELALGEYNQLSAEHDLLVQKYQNQINLWQEAERNTVESYLNNPSYRFLRDQYTIAATRELRRALQYAYLATKALEYDYLQPVAGPKANISDLYRASNSGDLLKYLNDLEAQRDTLQESPEPLSQQKYTISVARDILGLANPTLAEFQAFLQEHLVTEEINIGGSSQERLFLDFKFTTAINSRLHGGGFNPTGLWNTRITGNTKPAIACNVTNPCDGVGVNIVTNQEWSSTNLPLLSLSHGGQNGLQRENGSVADYDPGPIVLYGEATIGQSQPTPRKRGKTAAVSATVNNQGGIQRNPQLFNLSIAAADWTLRLDVEQNRQLDLSQITDIEIVLDTTSRARTNVQAANRPDGASGTAESGSTGKRPNVLPDTLPDTLPDGQPDGQPDQLPDLDLIVGAASINSQLTQSSMTSGNTNDPRETDLSELDPTGIRKIVDGTSDIRNGVCCVMFAQNLNECPDAKQISLGGILGDSAPNRVQAASLSAINAEPLIVGTYVGTVAITEPIAMGEIQIGITVDSVTGNQVSGSLSVSNTLLYQGDSVALNGTYENGVMTMTSQLFTGTLAGRLFQRQFTITAEDVRAGDALDGTYVEIIQGLSEIPLQVKGQLTGVRPVRNSIINDIPKGLLVNISPEKIPVSGTGMVQVQLRDVLGQPVTTAVNVTFSTDLGSVPEGTVTTLNGDASVPFTAGNTVGTAKVTAFIGDYRASATVEIVNDGSVGTPNNAPTVASQTSATTQGVAKEIILSGTDLDGDELAWTVVDQPENGELSGTMPNITYRPNPGFTGEDSFTFKVNDGTVDSAIATVTINVTEEAPQNSAPTANPQTINATAGTTQTISLTASDPDSDTLTFSIVEQPANGTVTLAGQVATYKPDADLIGVDSFTFKVNDGTVDSAIATVTINVIEEAPQNSAPIANPQTINATAGTTQTISLTASDPDSDTLTFSIVEQPANGTVTLVGQVATYKPDADFTGEDFFTFQVNDGTDNSALAKVTINVASAPEGEGDGTIFLPFVSSEPSSVTINASALSPETTSNRIYMPLLSK